MKKKLTKREIRNRLERISEATLGEPDDIDVEEAYELLGLANIALDNASSRIYGALHKEAKQYWMSQKTVPPLLKEALDQLRPSTEPARNTKELGTQARSRVEKIVEDTRIFPILCQMQEAPFQVSAYRGRTHLTAKDRSVLDQITREMKDKFRPGDKKGKR